MSIYTLRDLIEVDTIRIFHRSMVTNNRLVNFLFRIHNSEKINGYIALPFRGLWGHVLFSQLLKTYKPDYIVITDLWYSTGLIKYFRRNLKSSALVLRFTDTVKRSFCHYSDEKIKEIGKSFDHVLVYSDDDARKYGYIYCPVGYSKTPIYALKHINQRFDVTFIGADKGRLQEIRRAYHIFSSAGLLCFFYVTGVEKRDRIDDGIIYSDTNMPFLDYLSYEYASKCLFEIVQEGSTGRTYRLIESIIYNKLLITNCPEVLNMEYYKKGYIQYFTNVDYIDTNFVVNNKSIEYDYQGEFSPIHDLEFLEKI